MISSTLMAFLDMSPAARARFHRYTPQSQISKLCVRSPANEKLISEKLILYFVLPKVPKSKFTYRFVYSDRTKLVIRKPQKSSTASMSSECGTKRSDSSNNSTSSVDSSMSSTSSWPDFPEGMPPLLYCNSLTQLHECNTSAWDNYINERGSVNPLDATMMEETSEMSFSLPFTFSQSIPCKKTLEVFQGCNTSTQNSDTHHFDEESDAFLEEQGYNDEKDNTQSSSL